MNYRLIFFVACSTWYGGVVMGVLLSFDEAAILYRDFNSAPS